MTTSEKTYYSKNGVTITSARAVFGAKTYAVRNITSAQTVTIGPDRGIPVVMIVVGLVALLGSAFGALIGYAGHDTVLAVGLGICGFFMLLVMGAGIGIAVMLKPSYAVQISSSSGESKALVSRDQGEIGTIARALNDAIVGA